MESSMEKRAPSVLERLYNGLLKENPTFVLTLGMCPTLAVTTSAMNGLGMGLTTTVVLALSNAFIAMLRKVIPDKVRIPAFIVIIASFVTMMELLLEGFLPSLYDALGIYIPLIVVNCIILGRAESFASKNGVILSFFDGLGMGLGFSFALTCIGLVREILGSGKVFGYTVMPEGFVPVSIFVMAPGAFFVLAALIAVQNLIKQKGEAKGKDLSYIGSGCPGGCDACGIEGCMSRRFYDPKGKGSVEEGALSRETAAKSSEKEAAAKSAKKSDDETAEKPVKKTTDNKTEAADSVKPTVRVEEKENDHDSATGDQDMTAITDIAENVQTESVSEEKTDPEENTETTESPDIVEIKEKEDGANE